MTVQEAIKERRSVRQYRDQAIPVERLMALVELGLWAPTGGNAQTWRFVVVTDSKTVRALHAVSPGMLGHPPTSPRLS